MLWTVFEQNKLHIELFLNGKGRNVHTLVLMHDKEMCSHLSKQSKCGKARRVELKF